MLPFALACMNSMDASAIAELNGHYEPAVLGMPLGFPPIPDEEIDLISTWIEQGAPE